MIADERVRKIISDIVEKLIKGYQPDKIILFGSYAYGEPTEDSDIDMLIIKDTDKRRIDRCVEVRRIVYDPDRGIPFSPLVYTTREISRRLALGDDFVTEIIERGELLYEKRKANPC
jgi:predicted nucleotidyltransferase